MVSVVCSAAHSKGAPCTIRRFTMCVCIPLGWQLSQIWHCISQVQAAALRFTGTCRHPPHINHHRALREEVRGGALGGEGSEAALSEGTA